MKQVTTALLQRTKSNPESNESEFVGGLQESLPGVNPAEKE